MSTRMRVKPGKDSAAGGARNPRVARQKGIAFSALSLSLLLAQGSDAQSLGDIPFRMPGTIQSAPPKVPQKETSLEDFFSA